jgi:hypothetical protein
MNELAIAPTAIIASITAIHLTKVLTLNELYNILKIAINTLHRKP